MPKLDCLESWVVLNENIGELSEDDCLKLLKKEQEGRRRVQFILRLYGRFNRLRVIRERELLFQR